MARPEISICKDVDGVTVYGVCSPQSLAAYKRHGWTPVDDGDSETDPEDTSGADDHIEVEGPEPTIFD